MSKKMQLTVRVTSQYTSDLEGDYPRLARALKLQDKGLADANPSFYELAGQVDVLLYRYDGMQFSRVLARHKQALKDLYARTEEQIANRNLARADEFLYKIEDIFDQIESELD
ncbi:hypothetical protein [Desulfospira joergensenii]|uniref:hypothetical protein n=1 Tax=Desulfospira joergensenii TaxID=53329 RepID=UPI0003B61258|nr:hypothetical protein [Desulfospira joergensenii]